ncbi:hypothetical protein L226DRAFT_99775 [Lentinus tigrinus ALCF2SS1-7]|uniref:uncharacterized protein n=1 Tax=Lentinus tigrinus ALCF2SS1-7 TaxID=1328758 RepID=UPI001165F326|nr:hypothetical protein L226DRAFT_99775 [Lentinus tigrinus ALCF2SS1-7]
MARRREGYLWSGGTGKNKRRIIGEMDKSSGLHADSRPGPSGRKCRTGKTTADALRSDIGRCQLPSHMLPISLSGSPRAPPAFRLAHRRSLLLPRCSPRPPNPCASPSNPATSTALSAHVCTRNGTRDRRRFASRDYQRSAWADSRSLVSLLHLRALVPKTGSTSEMLGTAHRKRAQSYIRPSS